MNKEQRQHHILHLIEDSNGQHMLGTRELAEQFGVSEMTVRRDLQELSQDGLLRRQHGGAAPLRQANDHQLREVGIVLVSTTGKYADPFFNAILEGVDQKLPQLGYRIAYINTRSQISTAAQAQEMLRNHPVDGIILFGYVGEESIEYLRSNVRALIQTTDAVSPDVATIGFDGYRGIQEMVKHLINRGYRRLGFITGNYDIRQQAFLDSIKAHHLPIYEELCITVPFGLDGWTPELGHVGAKQLMQLSEPPDAIVCASDRIAIGAIQWLHQHGYHVPEDIAVTGFDNIPESAFTAPSLTTVHVHKQLMGELAAERVVKHIENPDEIPLFIQTPIHLVIRQSCGSEGT
ncbi:MAG: substrate-binding domain-containing protein [Chloroflexota bacterium]